MTKDGEVEETLNIEKWNTETIIESSANISGSRLLGEESHVTNI